MKSRSCMGTRLPVYAKTLTPYTGTSGFYSSILPDEASAQRIRQFIVDQGLDEAGGYPADELHCTIIYSPEAVPDSLIIGRNKVSTYALKADYLGPDRDYLVLLLRPTPELTGMHDKWRALGCVPTFAEYTPHVSLSHDLGELDRDELLVRLNDSLQTNPLHIMFGGEIVEDIRND